MGRRRFFGTLLAGAMTALGVSKAPIYKPLRKSHIFYIATSRYEIEEIQGVLIAGRPRNGRAS